MYNVLTRLVTFSASLQYISGGFVEPLYIKVIFINLVLYHYCELLHVPIYLQDIFGLASKFSRS